MILDWRKRRQIITVVIVVGALAFISLVLWLILRAGPSCNNGKKDANEEGVDCGGVCALQCKNTHAPLNTLWTKTFPVRDSVYDVASLVDNPNRDAGIAKLSYRIELMDAKGLTLLTHDYTTFVNPGDHVLLMGAGLDTGGVPATQARFDIDPNYSYIRASSSPEKKLSVVGYDLLTPDSAPLLYATIENLTPDAFDNVPVTALVSDRSGPLGISETLMEEIGPHEKKLISFTWPQKFVYEAANRACATPIDVLLILDRSGSMASDSWNPPQPLNKAKDAAANFAVQLSNEDQVAFLSFATQVTAPIEQPLTNDFRAAQSAIEATTIATSGVQMTDIADALRAAQAEFGTQRKRASAKQAIVLLTDGFPDYPKNPNDATDAQYPATQAIQTAKDIKDRGVAIYTIGLGKEVNPDFLRQLATYPEYYFAAPSGDDLGGIYRQVASSICKKGPSVVEITPRLDEVGQTTTH